LLRGDGYRSSLLILSSGLPLLDGP